jgi:thiol-disulfide isomerase/thioredoxin
MKKILISLLLFVSTISFAQIKNLPNVDVKKIDGSNFNFKNIDNNGNPIVISFWATWCKPCTKELNNIAEVYEDWQDETNVKLVAVSIDDRRSQSKVAPYVNSSGWEYEIYIDPNSDLKRAMGVSTVPHTFLLDKNKQIIWQHRGYVEGDEYELFDEILKL